MRNSVRNGAVFIFTENITLGNAKSTMKHTSAYKANQRINGKEEEKIRNNSRIALGLPGEPNLVRIFIYLKLNTKFINLLVVQEDGKNSLKLKTGAYEKVGMSDISK